MKDVKELKEVMFKSFKTGSLVFAKVFEAPTTQFFFCKNCEPQKIMCHANQGGRLTVNDFGQIIIELGRTMEFPAIHDEVVLVRASHLPQSFDFTKSQMWSYVRDWEQVQWAVYSQTVFQAVSFNHRTNGLFQGNTAPEVELVKGKLIDIVRQYPRGIPTDLCHEHYKMKMGPVTISHDTRWYRQCPDGVLTNCADPRPKS